MSHNCNPESSNEIWRATLFLCTLLFCLQGCGTTNSASHINSERQSVDRGQTFTVKFPRDTVLSDSYRLENTGGRTLYLMYPAQLDPHKMPHYEKVTGGETFQNSGAIVPPKGHENEVPNLTFKMPAAIEPGDYSICTLDSVCISIVAV